MKDFPSVAYGKWDREKSKERRALLRTHYLFFTDKFKHKEIYYSDFSIQYDQRRNVLDPNILNSLEISKATVFTESVDIE